MSNFFVANDALNNFAVYLILWYDKY